MVDDIDRVTSEMSKALGLPIGGFSEDGFALGAGRVVAKALRTALRPIEKENGRTGEEIRVGMIVKANDWGRKLAGLPLEVELTDARGLVLRRDKVKLSASGFEELRHATLDTAPTAPC